MIKLPTVRNVIANRIYVYIPHNLGDYIVRQQIHYPACPEDREYDNMYLQCTKGGCVYCEKYKRAKMLYEKLLAVEENGNELNNHLFERAKLDMRAFKPTNALLYPVVYIDSLSKDAKMEVSFVRVNELDILDGYKDYRYYTGLVQAMRIDYSPKGIHITEVGEAFCNDEVTPKDLYDIAERARKVFEQEERKIKIAVADPKVRLCTGYMW